MLYLPRGATYRKLFGSQIVSLIGTGLTTVALALLAYDLAGSRAGTVVGLLFATRMVANVCLAPLMAAATSRLPHTSVLVGADTVRVVAACALPFADQLWHVFVLVFILQAGAATYTPCYQATIRIVVEDERDYTNALALSRLAYDIEAIASPLLTAALLLIVGTDDLFLGTALGFAASAGLVIAAKLPRGARGHDSATSSAMPFKERAQHGIRLMTNHADLRPLLALNLAVASAGAYVLVLTVVVVQVHFGYNESLVPTLLAFLGAGSATSAACVPRFISVARGRGADEYAVMLRAGALLVCAMGCIGAVFCAAPQAWNFTLTAALWFTIGFAWAAVAVPMSLVIQRHTAKDDLSAVFAAQYSLSHACWLITYPAAGALGTISLVLAASVLAAATALAVLVAWHLRRARSNHRKVDDDGKQRTTH